MVYIRMANHWDYDNWAAMGATGWSWDEVLPWFRKSEGNVRGGTNSAAPTARSRSANSPRRTLPASPLSRRRSNPAGLNPDFNGPRQEGFGLYQSTIRNGERWRRRALSGPAPNLDVRTGWLVEAIRSRTAAPWASLSGAGGAAADRRRAAAWCSAPGPSARRNR